MFEYYVMNEDRYGNHKEIKPFNIFQNWILDEAVQKEVKKYLRAPKKYKHIKQYANPYLNREEVVIYGFEGFCEELRRLIMWQEWSRCEYEILVASLFDNNNESVKKIDCYDQCEKNIPMIAREVIYQWKHRDKLKDN